MTIGLAAMTAFGWHIVNGSSLFSSGAGLLVSPGNVSFGKLKSGEAGVVARRDIQIHNASEQTVTITAIEKSCGCTVVDLRPPVKLDGGDTLHASLELRVAKTRHGTVSHRIVLHTDEPARPTYIIPVTAFVEGGRRVKALPALVDFGRFGGWEKVSRRIRLDYAVSGALEVQSVSFSHPGIHSKLEAREPAGGLIFSVIVPQEFRKGSFEGTAEIVTSRGSAFFQYKGTKLGDVYSTDKTIVFRANRAAQAHKRAVVHHSPKVHLGDVTLHSEIDDVKLISVTEIEPGVSALGLTLAGGAERAPLRGKLRFSTRISEEPLVLECFVLGR